ncbi:MAG TPA: hypothetical protein VJ971_19420 [Methylomirabilota bacterium]|nr:hypothetical protein [Methylomirabilota bacterium]
MAVARRFPRRVIGDETLDLFTVSGPLEEISDRIRERRRGLHDQTPLDDPRPSAVTAGAERA